MSWATFEFAPFVPTVSTKTIWLGLRYMRSGSCISLPLLMSELLDLFRFRVGLTHDVEHIGQDRMRRAPVLPFSHR